VWYLLGFYLGSALILLSIVVSIAAEGKLARKHIEGCIYCILLAPLMIVLIPIMVYQDRKNEKRS